MFNLQPWTKVLESQTSFTVVLDYGGGGGGRYGGGDVEAAWPSG